MKITHNFDADELQRRIDNAVGFYERLTQDSKTRGAIVAISENSFIANLIKYEELRSAGYTLADSDWHSPDQILVRKPQQIIDAEVATITNEVTEAYTMERRALYDQHVLSVVEESVARERRIAERKQADVEAKLRAKLEQEALQALGEFQ